MSIATLRRYVETLPDDVQLGKRGMLEVIERHADGADEPLTWVHTTHAAEVAGVPERTLRGMARRWLRMQEQGHRPRVRVHKTSGGRNAHWRLCLEDCFRWRREHGGGPRIVKRAVGSDVAPLDEREATLQKYKDLVDQTW